MRRAVRLALCFQRVGRLNIADYPGFAAYTLTRPLTDLQARGTCSVLDGFLKFRGLRRSDQSDIESEWNGIM